MSDSLVVHVIGYFYKCPAGHEFDRLTLAGLATGRQVGTDPNPLPATKPCPQCSQSAALTYAERTHAKLAACPFGQCPIPPT